MREHGAARKLNDDFLRAIRQDLLDVNPYARELRQLGQDLADAEAAEQAEHHEEEAEAEAEAEAGVLGVRRRDPPLAIRVTTRTNSRDVGAVIVRDRGAAASRAPASIMIHLHDTDRPQFLHGHDPQRAPLCYPLLFPHGDLGWGYQFTYDCNDRKSVV